MDIYAPWEPFPGMQVHEQVAKLVEEIIHAADREAIAVRWEPVVDLSKLRPN